MNETMATHKEFPLLYMIYDETMSFLSGQNARRLQSNHSADVKTTWGAIDTETLYSGNYSIWHPQMVNLNSSGQFSGASMYRKCSETDWKYYGTLSLTSPQTA